MISASEVNDLINKKQLLIDSFDAVKKQRVYQLRDDLLTKIGQYKQQNDQLKDTRNPPADISIALNNLDKLETRVQIDLKEFKVLLSESETSVLKRDVSDAGTIGGNGFVFFRSTGKFSVPSGTLTQQQIEDNKKAGGIKSVRSKP